MTDLLETVLADLDAEGARLRGWVAGLDRSGWDTATPAPGWTVAHQIAHLSWTDAAARTAIEDPEGFAALVETATADPSGYVDAGAAEWVSYEPGELLTRWDAGRSGLAEALRGTPRGARIAWFGPPMSAASMATARLMETWAHGHDVAEALGIRPTPTERARHVAHLGVRTRDFAYRVRGETPPEGEFRVELAGPDGGLWTWGPEDAAERVTGSGYDFALLATRRRHPDDVDVRAAGDQAAHWLTIVQAFAGLPGPDPRRLSERSRT